MSEAGEKSLILLVDDRPENLLAMESALEELGCVIFKAGSGREALRLTLKHPFDLALPDVQMPDMDGFEVARLLRTRKASADFQIIFITAISKEQHYIQKGYDVGAMNYLFSHVTQTNSPPAPSLQGREGENGGFAAWALFPLSPAERGGRGVSWPA